MKFAKIQVLGNDFILLNDVIGLKNDELRQLSIKLCNPHYGVGGDGVVYLYSTNFQYYVRFFHPDGSETRLSLNGMLCIGKYLLIEESIINNCLSLNSLCGEKHLKFHEDDIEIDLGMPRLVNKYRLEYFKDLVYYVIDVETLHIVMMVDDVWQVSFEEIIKKIKNKNEYNITVCSLIPHGHDLNVRTYNHVIGEMLSSGGGGASAFYIYRKFYHGKRCVTLHYPGGEMVLEEGGYQQILLRSKAKLVFKGTIEI